MMYIKEYEKFIRNLKSYNINTLVERNSNYIAYFLFDAFLDIKKIGINHFIEELNYFNKDGIEFELVDLNLDLMTSFVYFSETYNEFIKKIDDNTRLSLLNRDLSIVDLCKRNLINYTVMTKENFIHILLAWNKILDDLPPFVLLYKDDKDWYDILPFDSQDAMEKFVADHRKSV